MYMTGRYLDVLQAGEFPFPVSLTLWNIIFLIGRLKIGEFGPVGKRATGGKQNTCGRLLSANSTTELVELRRQGSGLSYKSAIQIYGYYRLCGPV